MKRSLFLFLSVACLFYLSCKKKEELPNPNKPTPVGENPVTAPVDYLGAVAKGKQSAEKTLSTVSLDQAIKVFYQQEDRYPKNLEELVSAGVVPSIPAPTAGMKFDYDPASGRVKAVQK